MGEAASVRGGRSPRAPAVLIWVLLALPLLAQPEPGGERWWRETAASIAGEQSIAAEARQWLELARAGGVGVRGKLLAGARRPGASGIAAILGLGGLRPAFVRSKLRALMDDTVVGRGLLGDADWPVPLEKRVAAAIALGRTGDVRARAWLVAAARDPQQLVAVRVAALQVLSLAPEPREEPLFAGLAFAAREHAQVREAAASAYALLPARDAGRARRLALALRSDPAGAGRGAVRALWALPSGEADEALLGQALASRDPGLRGLALVAAASRGDARAPEALTEALRSRDRTLRGYATIGLGVLAQAAPRHRDRVERALATLSRRSPQVRTALALVSASAAPLAPSGSYEELALRNSGPDGHPALALPFALLAHRPR
jgi:hypothetical protein